MDAIVERALITGAVPTASSAERWTVCPPSYKLELACADGEESEEAKSGKRIHKAMERWQDDPVTVIADCGLVEDEIDLFKRAVEFRQYNLEQIFKGEQVDYIIEEREFLNIGGKDYCSGEPDLAVLGRETGILYIEDFKSGRVKVESITKNKQLKTLAAILYKNYDCKIKRILWSVNQPREKCVDRWVEVDAAKFNKLVLDTAAAAKEAIENDGTGHKAGVHCVNCKAKANCPIMQGIVKNISETKEQIVQKLTDAKLAELLTEAKTVKKYIELVEEEAFYRAINGNPPPGFELKKDGRRFGVTAIDDYLGKEPRFKPALDAHIKTVTKSVDRREIDDKDKFLSDLKELGLTEVQQKAITMKLVRIE